MNRLGEVYTFRKQEKVNKGFGVIDPNKVFYVEDQNGKIIIDGKRCKIVTEKPVVDYTIIGGKKYHFITINNKTWLLENLEYADENITLGATGTSSTIPRANYYNNDPNDSYGLLYNYAAVKYIDDNRNTICPGWRVPTGDELAEIQSLGTAAIRSTEWNGTNDSGFSLLPAGQYTGSFEHKGASTGLYSTTLGTSTVKRLNSFGASTTEMSWVAKTTQISLRLIKDA